MSDQMVPPTPPPSGGGFDPNAAVEQFKGADPLDLVVVGAGVLAFLLSLFHGYYTISIGGLGGSVSAWHGFWGWAGVLLLLAAAVVTAAKIVRIEVPQGELIVVGTAVAGLLFTLIAFVVNVGNVDSASAFGFKIDEGRGWTYWLILIAALASGGVTGLKFARARGLVK